MASPKKKGLGRGLDALISSRPQTPPPAPQKADAPEQPTAEPSALPDGSTLIAINPHDIRPNPKQPRHTFDEEALQELADSIRHDGVQEPVIVRKTDGGYELVSGERRVRASILAELESIPAVCRDVSDRNMLKLGLIENIQREDLNPIELAKGYSALIEEFDWTQEELAEEVGKKRATITNTLRLLNLPEEVQRHVQSGALSMGHARALLALDAPDKQTRACKRILQEGLSVRQAEKLASAPAGPKDSSGDSAAEKDPHETQIEDELRRRFGTRVSLKRSPKNRGKIEIEFFNLDDLERILELLRS